MKTLKDIAHLRKVFPASFLWGASISTHQVEGKNLNQWTVWEHETAARLAKTAPKRLKHIPIWDEVKSEATNPHNYVSGRAVDHRGKYKIDFQLARRLNMNAFRSGIEWSRICPEEGKVDLSAVEYYNQYFSEMRRYGLEPILTLFHWSEPVWFAKKGGFEKKENLRYWDDFIHALCTHFDFSPVQYVLTINEANTYMGMGYANGEFPPGKKNIRTSLVVYRNLALAHRRAYKRIKALHPKLQIGTAQQFQNAVGYGLVGKIMARLELEYSNWSWMRMSRYHDFVGFNYYFTDYRRGVSLMPDANPRSPVNDLGWYMEPSGIERVIRQTAKKFKGKPIMITENGVADQHDQYREWWITETIEAMARCVQDGIPLVGYLHWSLLDNFEWQYGWFPKFGLVSVNRRTMERRVKQSARLWSAWLGKK